MKTAMPTRETGFERRRRVSDAAAAPPAMRFLRSRRSLRGAVRARERRVDAEVAPVDGDGRRVLQDVAAGVASSAAGHLEARYGPRIPVRLEKQDLTRDRRRSAGALAARRVFVPSWTVNLQPRPWT